MNNINKHPISCNGRIVIRPESSIYKNLNQPAGADEFRETKSLNQKWQNVLCSNSFKALGGTIEVFERKHRSLELVMVLLTGWKDSPKSLHDCKRLWPPHMAIPSNHIFDDKNP